LTCPSPLTVKLGRIEKAATPVEAIPTNFLLEIFEFPDSLFDFIL
jgi:hypothetical protein